MHVYIMHATLLQTYYWPQKAACFTSTYQHCVHCATSMVQLQQRENSLKIFQAVETVESETFFILGPVAYSRLRLQILHPDLGPVQ